MQTIPIVKDELGRSWDIGSALLQQRIIFLNGEIKGLGLWRKKNDG